MTEQFAHVEDLLGKEIFGNDLLSWIAALVVLILAVIALRVVRRVVVARLRPAAEKTVTRADDSLVDVLEHTKSWFLLVLATWLALQVLELSEDASILARRVLIVVLLVQLGVWGGRLLELLLDQYSARKEGEEALRAGVLGLFGFFTKVALWTVVFIVSAENLGFDITALIAGLGLGGIAVGLALQNVLKDAFGSLSIVLDKPFEVGDFIIVGDLLGTVEKIGLKTTRVRSLGGEQLVFGNDDLLSSRIRNYKRMAERRVVFSFGVVYQTAAEALDKIPGLVRKIIEDLEQTRFDRAHFKSFGSSSLDFEVVYFILDPDYNLFMDIQQSINLELYRRFEEQDIDFAYPTRTLYMPQVEGPLTQLVGGVGGES